MGKSDVKSAFRLIPLSLESFPWLIMKARHPISNEWCYFVDKCLPFGASISCALFQRFSDALCHIVQYKTGSKNITNILDDFLFVAYLLSVCNAMIQEFLDICKKVGIPIALDKTEWATVRIIFLGILLDRQSMTLAIPLEKRLRAIQMLQVMVSKKKATVKELQTLCGFLNFLNKAIFPGHTFTRHMYTKFSQVVDLRSLGHHHTMDDKVSNVSREYKLCQHHHVRLDSEFKLDCKVWLNFLDNTQIQNIVNRKIVDLLEPENGITNRIYFTSDASAAPHLGYSCIMNNRWMYGKWEEDFIEAKKPSIEYLQLFALTAGIMTWSQVHLKNCKLVVWCDNKAVVQMINNLTSSCRNCLFLLRLLVLDGMKNNRQLIAKYISTSDNYLSDSLSRLKIEKFKRLAPQTMLEENDEIIDILWPISKLWIE